MAEVTKVKASDGTIFDINDADDYTKEEVDDMLALKADVGLSYTKSEEEALLAEKANTSSVETALANKADITSVYTKSETDTLLDSKASVGDSYTKAEDDALLADKADVGDSYTKAEDDALLADKADSTDVYTKAEVDALIGGIKMFPKLDFANPLHAFSADNLSYTADRDCFVFGAVNTARTGSVTITINSTPMTVNSANGSASDNVSSFLTPYIKLKLGDTITVSSVQATLYVFEEL